jgi:hypothetical protein
MILSMHKCISVYKKTDHKCAICGDKKNLTCVCFIPEWTRIVSTDVENIIPMCDECRLKRGKNFIEIGTLRYLPEIYIAQLLRYYRSISMYLYKYVRLYGKNRTNGLVDIERTLLIMQSYDCMIKEHKDDLDWESL